MSVEAATNISELDSDIPTSSDYKSEGDDHIRLVKYTIKQTFNGITGISTSATNNSDAKVATTSMVQAAILNSSGITAVLPAQSANTVLFSNGSVLSFSQIKTINGSAIVGSASDIQLAGFGVQSFTGAQRCSISSLTDGSTITPDISLSNMFSVTLGGNRTLGIPTNAAPGQQGTISIHQDTTGSRTLSYAWGYQWAGGVSIALSTTAGARDLLAYSVDAYNSGTVTITIATPGVVTMNAHGFVTGQKVQLTTTGALPTGLSANTTYFVRVIDTNTFNLSTSLANACAGTYIATSGTQSGVHTLVGCAISLSLSKSMA